MMETNTDKGQPIRIEVVLLAIAMWFLIQSPGMVFAFSFTHVLIILAIYLSNAMLSFIITLFLMNKFLEK